MAGVGVGFPLDLERALPVLRESGDCFGHHSASASECRECSAPIVADGRLHLFRDLCRERTTGERPRGALLWQPSSQDVREALARGQDASDMLARMTGGDPDLERTARRVLGARLSYLRRTGLPVPDLP